MKRSPPALVILDFDGVVADSELLSNKLLSEFLTSEGLPTTLDQAITRYMGRRWEDCAQAIAAEMGRPLAEDFRDRYRAFQAGRMRRDVGPVLGVGEFLSRHTPQHRFCVASSSAPDWLDHCVDKFDLRAPLGRNLFSATAVKNGKPAPDIFLHAAEQMAATPAQCLVLEDSAAGVRGAVAAGMTVLGFLGGSHIRDGHGALLLEAGAHGLVQDFAAVSQHLAHPADHR